MQRDRKQTSGCPGLVVGGCGQMAVTAQWVQGFLLLWWKCLVLDGVVVSQHWECTKCRWIGHLQMDIFLLWPSSHNMHVYQIILNFYNAVCQPLLWLSLSHVWLFVTPWTAARQALLSFTIFWSLLKLCPSSWWCHPAISSSVVPFSSCLPSFPASGAFLMSPLFAPGGQTIGVSASASVLPMNIQDWFPLGWTGWISLQPKEFSRVFPNTIQKYHFFSARLSL